MIYPEVQIQERTFANKVKRKLREKVVSKIRGKLPARFGGTRGRSSDYYGAPVPAALIGVGNIARWAYLPRLKAGSHFQLRGVFDVDVEAARKVADEFGAKLYSSLEELVESEETEAVFVCSPAPYHCEAAVSALARGKHVLCEKPLAASYSDARSMWEAAQNAAGRNMVNFSYRFRPSMSYFVDLIRSGILGDVYHLSGVFSQGGWYTEDGEASDERVDAAPWRFKSGGGVVHELGPHIIDILRLSFGEIARIQAWTEPLQNSDPGCENACGLSLKFKRGLVAQLLTSRMATGYREHAELEVTGSHGCLKYAEDTLKLWTREYPEWRDLLVPNIEGLDFLAAFRGAIHDRSKRIPGFWDGFKANEALEAIQRSADSGSAVALPLDE